MKYLALLRGINVGGNNKVPMKDLRTCFESAGFTNVSTYIASGNIFFDADETEPAKLVKRCEVIIETAFGFPVVVMIISKTEYQAAMQAAPEWWGNGDRKQMRSDAVFVIPPTTAEEVLSEIKLKPGAPDKLAASGHVIFWSLPMEAYNKSVVPKIIGTPVYRRLTMRSSTTAKKLLELFNA